MASMGQTSALSLFPMILGSGGNMIPANQLPGLGGFGAGFNPATGVSPHAPFGAPEDQGPLFGILGSLISGDYKDIPAQAGEMGQQLRNLELQNLITGGYDTLYAPSGAILPYQNPYASVLGRIF